MPLMDFDSILTWSNLRQPSPSTPPSSASKGLSIHLPAEGDVITSFLTSQQSCPSCFERFALWTWCYRGGRGDANNRLHLLANSSVEHGAGPLRREAEMIRKRGGRALWRCPELQKAPNPVSIEELSCLGTISCCVGDGFKGAFSAAR